MCRGGGVGWLRGAAVQWGGERDVCRGGGVDWLRGAAVQWGGERVWVAAVGGLAAWCCGAVGWRVGCGRGGGVVEKITREISACKTMVPGEVPT